MTPIIIAETPAYFVINKPAGMAVEPPSHDSTLLDWLIEQEKIETGEWPKESRLGVVHRIDTDTSGLVIWAKTPAAQEELKTLWQGRQVEKTYLALVVGECEPSGTIELAMARDNKKDRQKVVWLQDGSARPALTHYQTLSVGHVGGQTVSLVEVHPVTGRTHQIRVHFKAIGHPLVGDKLYGEKLSDSIAQTLRLDRHFLHAWKICLPAANEQHCYTAPLAEDLVAALTIAGLAVPLS